MNHAIFPFTLDLAKTLSQISIPVTLGDFNRRFMIALTNFGKPYRLTDGCMAIFTGAKADGTILYNECSILDHTVIRYDFTEQTTSAPGRIDCQLKIYGENGEIMASPRFTMIVYRPSVDIDGIVSEDEKLAIENMIAKEAERVAAEEERQESFEAMMATMPENVANAVLDDVIREVMDKIDPEMRDLPIYIGPDQPNTYPILWFDTSGYAEEAEPMLLSEEEEHDVMADVEGTMYGISNAGVEDETKTYNLKIT